jgi:hypothetical protein
MPGDRPIEVGPRKVLQKPRKHRSLNRHGIDLQLEPERPPERLNPVESMPCTLSSNKRAGQPWARPGNPP